MKRILSVFLVVAMLVTMFVMPATAEDNSCLVFKGAGMGKVEGSSIFTTAYFYTETPYVSRDPNEPVATWDYTIVFDLYIDDYTIGSDYQPGFVFTHDVGRYSTGYDFNKKAFVFDTRYMCNANPEDTNVYKSVGYDLQKGKWYEIGYAMRGCTVYFYVDGILVFEFDMRTEVDKGFTEWIEKDVASGNYDGSDYLFLHTYEADLRFDNMTIYSGDYDFATGKATTVHKTDDAAHVPGDNTINFCGFEAENMNQTWYIEGNNGTSKVTYDRAAAAGHVHNLQLSEHADPTCTTEGYDLVNCSCGMGQRENVVPALGHLPGFSEYTEEPTEFTNGIDLKICNRCFENYYIVTEATGDANCLYLTAKGSAHIYNGYTALNNANVMAQNDGLSVSLDIMPEEHMADKPHAGHGAQMGGGIWLGYSYAREAFIIANGASAEATDAQVIAETKADLAKYEWATWTFVRKSNVFTLYIDGEAVVTATVDPAIVDGQYIFLFNSHSANIYLDNFIIADPNYDLKSKAGVIYDYTDFSNGIIGTDGMTEAGLCGVIAFDPAVGAGYHNFKGGRPMADISEVHKDMAIYVDDPMDGSGGGYAQLLDRDGYHGEAMDAFKAAYAEGKLDFEFAYNFKADQWCTDEAVLNGSSPYIGGYINTSNFNSGRDGGFAGYDFLRQQVIIGAIDGMWNGKYNVDDNGNIVGTAADFKVEAGKWYKMSVSYKQDADLNVVVTVKMNDTVVATHTYEFVDVSYYIFYPNFVDCYIDGITVRLGDYLYDNNNDFTNGFGVQSGGMDFSGPAWALVEGGMDTHVANGTKYPASCETDGYTVYDCSCGEAHYTLYNLPAQGHAWDGGVVSVEPTFNSVGEMLYTCTVCGDTKTEEIPVVELEYVLGDANADGVIDASDVQVLKRFIAGLSATIHEEAADINEDGVADASDLQILVRYTAGLSTVLG